MQAHVVQDAGLHDASVMRNVRIAAPDGGTAADLTEDDIRLWMFWLRRLCRSVAQLLLGDHL
jgi:hypothetical protein